MQHLEDLLAVIHKLSWDNPETMAQSQRGKSLFL